MDPLPSVMPSLHAEINYIALLDKESDYAHVNHLIQTVVLETIKQKFGVCVSEPIKKEEPHLGVWIEYILENAPPLDSILFYDFHNSIMEASEASNILCRIKLGRMPNDYFDYCLADVCLTVKTFGWANSFYPNILVEHFAVDHLDCGPLRNKIWFQTVKNLDGSETEPIYCNFYHDTNMMTLFFMNRLNQIDVVDNQTRNMPAMLSLVYQGIQKISVSIKRARRVTPGPNESPVLSYDFKICFHLDVPVCVKTLQDYFVKVTETYTKKYTEFRRARTFCQAQVDYSMKAIHESSIFYMELRDVHHLTFSNILERIRSATSKDIIFENFKIEREDHTSYVPHPFQDIECTRKVDLTNSFPLKYVIEAIFSRGFIIADQLLRDINKRDAFIDSICTRYSQNASVTLNSLEETLRKIDETFIIKDVMLLFSEIYEQQSKFMGASEMNLKEDYIYVRKAIITPTRVILKVAEQMMSNRMLRKFDPNGQKTIRLIFKDEDGKSMKDHSVGDKIICDVLSRIMIEGIVVAGKTFNYLGASNSQMRSNGCYYYEGDKTEIVNIRTDFGAFKRENVPKMMARIGQCFTQAMEAKATHIDKHNSVTESDFTTICWTANKVTEKEGIFSDGCATVSLKMANDILKALRNFKRVSACYQIRFRGFKGVLSVNPYMDKAATEAFEKGIKLVDLKIKGKGHLKEFPLDIKFRQSQKKFKGSVSQTQLEIVKPSAPSQLSLNRPLLNVLDQVSEMQSSQCNEKIVKRVHELFDRHVSNVRSSLLTEKHAYMSLCDMSTKHFGVKHLIQPSIVSFQTEPFFKSLINAAAIYQIRKVLKKLKIQIPSTLGRTMFGIIDESGALEYGQVFIQYADNVNIQSKDEFVDVKRITHTGKVMITKNPTVVSGDVRMFEAVDIPQLHHLIDVVVFPRDGPRPHSDEMAGSDLDGDEYSIFFDTELFIDYSMPAFDFTPTASKKEESLVYDSIDLDDKMKDFMIDYVKTDPVGKIATAHLIASDFYGLESEVCHNIAMKHNQAVDFAKTGVFPEKLTSKGTKSCPPEQSKIVPDFIETRYKFSYQSNRLVGQLYRRLNTLQNLLSSNSGCLDKNASVNPLFECEGWETHREKVTELFIKYSAAVNSLLDMFGIDDEAQLFSGFRMEIRNRVTDEREDIMSYFNADVIIAERIKILIYTFRKEILEYFCSMDEHYPLLHKKDGLEYMTYILETPVSQVSVQMKQFGVACYKIAFERADRSSSKILSFPWIVWDFLRQNAYTNMLSSNVKETFEADIFGRLLSDHIINYCKTKANRIKLREFLEPLVKDSDMKEVQKYLKRYVNLGKLLFFFKMWCEENNLLFKIETKLLVVILIQMSCGFYSGVYTDCKIFLDRISDCTAEELNTRIDINEQIGGIGRLCLHLFSVCSSYKFKTSDALFGCDMGMNYDKALMNYEWDDLYARASDTINALAFSQSLTCLPQYCAKARKVEEQVLSHGNMLIHIPRTTNNVVQIVEKLKAASGLTDLKIRLSIDVNKRHTSSDQEYLVTPIGTCEAYNRFCTFVTPQMPTKIVVTDTLDASVYLGQKLFDKIRHYSHFNDY
uniref:RNA-directed RNA polymerase n=1 Tax=Rhabditophanes sp. KR3021 TaxID=114890 RepID=A0AC35UCD8_9BILA